MPSFATRRGLVALVLVVAMVVAVFAFRGVNPRAGAAEESPRATPSEANSADPKPEVPQRQSVVWPKKPNVVLVMADDMRVDDLAFAPQLRRLIAQHGVTFENSFAPFPLCCPARASLLTGQYSHNHKVYWHEPPYGYGAFNDSRTLATSLRAAGYRTGFIGKYLNRYGVDRSKVSGMPSYRYVPRGWDDWRAAVENPGNAGFTGGTYQYYDTPFNVNGVIDNRYRGVYQSKVIGDISVGMASRFAAGRKPFFMYVNYVAPHHGGPIDRSIPGSVRDRWGRTTQIVTPAVPDAVRGLFNRRINRASGVAKTGERVERNRSDKPAAMRRQTYNLDARGLRLLREATRRRAEAVFVMDRHIGRLIRELKKSGEWRNTVFAFTSDNGFLLGEHGFSMAKVWPYEPSLRVPMLVTGPGLRTQQHRFDPISTVDLTATILDIADAKAPMRGDGISRLPSLLEGDQGWTTPVVTEAVGTGPGRSRAFTDARTSIGIRTSRYSYSRYRSGAVELYDLLDDPRQDRNVAKAPAYADIREAFDELWPRVKDCAGDQCRVQLPAELSADPASNRSNTKSYWHAIRAAYGW